LKVSYNSTIYSTCPDAGYPDRIDPSGKSVENSKKLTCLEITGYRIKYSPVLWLLERQIRRGRYVWKPIHNVSSNSRFELSMYPIFREKSSHPDFLHIWIARHHSLIRMSGVLLYMSIQRCIIILHYLKMARPAELCCNRCYTDNKILVVIDGLLYHNLTANKSLESVDSYNQFGKTITKRN